MNILLSGVRYPHLAVSGSTMMHFFVVIHCDLRLIVFVGHLYVYAQALSCSQPQCFEALFHKPCHLALDTLQCLAQSPGL